MPPRVREYQYHATIIHLDIFANPIVTDLGRCYENSLNSSGNLCQFRMIDQYLAKPSIICQYNNSSQQIGTVEGNVILHGLLSPNRGM